MTSAAAPRPAGGRRRPPLRVVLPGLLLALAAVGGAPGPRQVQEPPVGPTAAGPAPAAGIPAPLGPLRVAPARSAPVALRIPALGLAVPLGQLGLNPDGTVQVPTDFSRPGWFRLGPSPGQTGSAVILGHVDSYTGPAVFFRLRSLHPGDRIEVSLADGLVTRFAVRAVRTYLKRDFPARQVYGSRGYSALQLVTCGGEFDTRARSYLSNVVVYAALVGTGPEPGRVSRP